jgi:5-formyltetrahydrofolate cyclo-ligase
MAKQALRQRLLEQRSLLSPAYCEEAGRKAQLRCMKLPAFVAAKVVALYSPIRNEVDTSLLVDECLGSGKIVLMPAVTVDGLQFRRMKDRSELVCASFGICEPLPEAERFEPERIDFILVPGVAFDLLGLRIGYGKGYYDRTLHTLEGKGRMAGFCYDFQLVESIASAPHDVQMDMVITDLREVLSPGQFT